MKKLLKKLMLTAATAGLLAACSNIHEVDSRGYNVNGALGKEPVQFGSTLATAFSKRYDQPLNIAGVTLKNQEPAMFYYHLVHADTIELHTTLNKKPAYYKLFSDLEVTKNVKFIIDAQDYVYVSRRPRPSDPEQK